MRWNAVCGKSGYIDMGFVMIPTYQLSEHELILFDSGADFGGKLLEELERKNQRVRAVFCTHMHWDHIGGNKDLVARHGAEIFAHTEAIADSKFTEVPTYPIRALQDETELIIDGARIEIVPTPGHSPGHVAYATPDGVCCLGDAMMSEQLIRRAKLPHLEDVDEAIVTMERIRRTRYAYYLTSHKGVTEQKDLPALVDENIQKELDLYDLMRRQITGPRAEEDVLMDFMLAAGIQRNTIERAEYIRNNAKTRLEALVKAGEYYLADGMVIPCQK